VGNRSAVAEVFGLRFSGFLAWAMWRAVYLYKMPGVSKRVRVGINWLLDAAFGAELAELTAVRPARPPLAAPNATLASEDVPRDVGAANAARESQCRPDSLGECASRRLKTSRPKAWALSQVLIDTITALDERGLGF
jgi:hypothetical protein